MEFPHERQRIELALFMQLAGYTGNRPKAILNLKYKDIRVSLLQVLGLETPRLFIEPTFRMTKVSKAGADP